MTEQEPVTIMIPREVAEAIWRLCDKDQSVEEWILDSVMVHLAQHVADQQNQDGPSSTGDLE